MRGAALALVAAAWALCAVVAVERHLGRGARAGGRGSRAEPALRRAGQPPAGDAAGPALGRADGVDGHRRAGGGRDSDLRQRAERRRGPVPRRPPQRPGRLPQRDRGADGDGVLAARVPRRPAHAQPAAAGGCVQRGHHRARAGVPHAVPRRADRLRLRRRRRARARARPAAAGVADDHGGRRRGDRERAAAQPLRRLPGHREGLRERDRLRDARAGGGDRRVVRRRARAGAVRRRSAALGVDPAGRGPRGRCAPRAAHGRCDRRRPRRRRRPGATRQGQGERVQAARDARARGDAARLDLGPALRPLARGAQRVQGQAADRRRRGQLSAALLRPAQDRPQPLDAAQPAHGGAGRDRPGGPAAPAGNAGRRNRGGRPRLARAAARLAPPRLRAAGDRGGHARPSERRLAVADPRDGRPRSHLPRSRRRDRHRAGDRARRQ